MSKNSNLYPVVLKVAADNVLPTEFKMAVKNMHQARRMSRALLRDWRKEAGHPPGVNYSFQRKLGHGT